MQLGYLGISQGRPTALVNETMSDSYPSLSQFFLVSASEENVFFS